MHQRETGRDDPGIADCPLYLNLRIGANVAFRKKSPNNYNLTDAVSPQLSTSRT